MYESTNPITVTSSVAIVRSSTTAIWGVDFNFLEVTLVTATTAATAAATAAATSHWKASLNILEVALSAAATREW